MKARVLPRKQLEHVLEKTGFVKLDCGDWDSKDIDIDAKQLLSCGKLLDLVPMSLSYYKDAQTGSLWKKDWFIPNSFEGDEVIGWPGLVNQPFVFGDLLLKAVPVKDQEGCNECFFGDKLEQCGSLECFSIRFNVVFKEVVKDGQK